MSSISPDKISAETSGKNELNKDVKPFTATDMPDSTVIHNDSGHESSGSVSTPEIPLTPKDEEPQTIENSVQNTEEKFASTRDSAEKFFHIKILEPDGGENIDVQISGSDIMQELYQMLLERDSTCHRTCFQLYYEGNPLDQFTEIRNVPNIKDHATFRVVEGPYNIREARVHIRHLREIIRSLDISDAINGVEFASLTCLSSITQTTDDGRKSTRTAPSAEIRNESDCMPPEWLIPGAKELPIEAFIVLNNNGRTSNNGYGNNNGSFKSNQFCALKQISFSPFNPPPGPRKMKGDVLYLVVDTFEERRFHITCCTRGFYVNSTVGEKFKPEKSTICGGRCYHSLFDLLSELSSHFKKTLSQILKIRAEKHIFERLPTPYQHYQWIVPIIENISDQIRADEQIQPHRLGLEDHMPGQIRDWNEELQTTHDLPQGTYAERLCRDRARFKVHADFLAACVRGAMAVVDGSVHSINPADERKMQMHIWNNIFYSFGFDVKDHYKDIRGDAAAHASYSADLLAVQAYAQIDDPKLHTCGMAVIDFKGYRLMAQSIIPGILDREQHEPIIYGSIDSGKTIVSNDAYEELLANSAKILKIQPHLVWNGKEGDESKFVKIYSSYESKGILGNERRHYLMDLFRTFPPDVNFLDDVKPTEKAKAQGFPRKFKHKLVYLRRELVDTFIDAKVFWEKKLAMSSENQCDYATIKNEVEEVQLNDEQKCEGNDDVDLRLNPDCYSKAITHHADEDLQSQRALVSEAAEFILVHQIPQFVNDCVQLAAAPIDGLSLTETLHARGINIRYLGKIIEIIQENDRLFYLTIVAKLELLCRCVRHVFRDYIQGVEGHYMGKAIAHFLNCLIGSSDKNGCSMTHQSSDTNLNNGNTAIPKKNSMSKKKRKIGERNAGTIGIGSSPTPKSMMWNKLTQESLWKSISDDSDLHFGLRIPSDCCDSFLNWSGGARRIAILRRFCIMNGVQVALKNYQFDPSKSKSQTPFTEDDIFNLVPVVKRLNPRSQSAYSFYLNALVKMQQGFPRIGYDLMQQAYSMMMSIYGPLHPDLALCLRFMARMAFAMNDYPDALAQQHRALLISERCNGIDHFETITDYINLAHFSFVNLCIPSSLKLLYRARYLMLIANGEDHPQMGQIDANIGVILCLLQEFDLSLKFLNNALNLYQKYGVCVKTALLHHVIARAHSCRGDFRTALSFEKETFNIYSRIFGKEHEKTLVSNERLCHLTKQAVTLQKHMHEATNGQKSSKQLMPNFQIQSPSLQNIIELLNAFNNFLFWKIQIQTE